mgnify:CR=1 FL=1
MSTFPWPQRVSLREVGLRDGLQSVARTLPTPQKIDFLLAPPRITQRYWLPAVPRSYRRVSPVELETETRRPLDVGVKDVNPA